MKMNAIDQKIQDFLQRMEKCGEEGKVDEAQALMKQVEILKVEKDLLKNVIYLFIYLYLVSCFFFILFYCFIFMFIFHLILFFVFQLIKFLIHQQNAANGPHEKKMEVCQTCGAFLVVGDTQKRTDSHIEGKQHSGYDTIRKTAEEFRVSFLYFEFVIC